MNNNTKNNLFKVTVGGLTLGLGAAAVLGSISVGYGLVKEKKYEKAFLNIDTKMVSYEDGFNYGEYLEKQLNVDFSTPMDNILNNQTITDTLRYINEIRELNEYDELNTWQQKRYLESSNALINNAPIIENLSLQLGKEKLAEDLKIDLNKYEINYRVSTNSQNPGGSIVITENNTESNNNSSECILSHDLDNTIKDYYSSISSLQSCKRVDENGEKGYTTTTDFTKFTDVLEDVIAYMPIYAGYNFEAEYKNDGSIKEIKQTGDILNITNSKA